MLLYLDMCCLKRPFDDQSQPRIRLETEAILNLLAMEGDRVRFVRSAALILENRFNRFNPIVERASRVEQWLVAAPRWQSADDESLPNRVIELMKFGLTNFDALHVASAEEAGADLLATTDDRLISAATRAGGQIRTEVCLVVRYFEELSR